MSTLKNEIVNTSAKIVKAFDDAEFQKLNEAQKVNALFNEISKLIRNEVMGDLNKILSAKNEEILSQF